jgi:hypothetical protein
VQCSAGRTRWRIWRLALAAVVDPGVSSEQLQIRDGMAVAIATPLPFTINGIWEGTILIKCIPAMPKCSLILDS